MPSMSMENFSFSVVLLVLVIVADSAPRFQHPKIPEDGSGDLPPGVRDSIENDDFLPWRRFRGPSLGGNDNIFGPIFSRNQEDNFIPNNPGAAWRPNFPDVHKGLFSRFPIIANDEHEENDGEDRAHNGIEEFAHHHYNPFREGPFPYDRDIDLPVHIDPEEDDHEDREPDEDDDKYHRHDEVGLFHGGFIFDTPFFNVRQISKYFQQLEKALEHVFRQTMDEASLLNGTYANTTEEEVEINGKKYLVQKSIIKGKDNNNSIYIEALSSVPKMNETKVIKDSGSEEADKPEKTE